jgi:hypothetical protein
MSKDPRAITCRLCREPAVDEPIVTPFGTFSLCRPHWEMADVAFGMGRRVRWDDEAGRVVGSEDDLATARDIGTALRVSTRFGKLPIDLRGEREA